MGVQLAIKDLSHLGFREGEDVVIGGVASGRLNHGFFLNIA